MERYLIRFRDYLVRTYKNKIMAMVFMMAGYLSYLNNDGDGTLWLFTILFGLPLFIMDEVEEE